MTEVAALYERTEGSVPAVQSLVCSAIPTLPHKLIRACMLHNTIVPYVIDNNKNGKPTDKTKF